MTPAMLARGLCLGCLLALGGEPVVAQYLAAGLPARHDPAPFEGEIAAFEAQDRAQPPAAGGVVFLGSSSLRMWPGLAESFPGLRVLNRGFGGATFPDLIRYAPRIALPLAPSKVVLYAGDNDIDNGRSPDQVLADYRQLAAILRRNSPNLDIVLVSIKPSPRRWAKVEAIREANVLLARELQDDPRSRFVDVFTPMLDSRGQPRVELFTADALHLSAAGYALWRELIAAALGADAPDPNRNAR